MNLGFFWDAILIISLMVWVLGLAIRGGLDTSAAAWVLIALLALMAVSRGLRIGIARLTFRLALAVVSLLTFAALYGQEEMMPLLGAAAVLFFVLFGFYIMIRGLFPGHH